MTPGSVRHAGAWKDKWETMPDTFLRESTATALDAQEKCFLYLRQGRDTVFMVGHDAWPEEEVSFEDPDILALRPVVSVSAPSEGFGPTPGSRALTSWRREHR